MRSKQMSVEGQVYRCTWGKLRELFVLKCLSPVKARVTNENVEQAKDDLRAQIMTLTGDGEAVLQFDEPFPETATKRTRFIPEYYHFGYNDSVAWNSDVRSELFTGGICKLCGTGLGIRTNVPRVVASLPKYDVVGFDKDKNVRSMISERLLRYLRPFLSSEVNCIEVKFLGKLEKRIGSRKFYELDFRPTSEVGIPKSNDGFGGWRCSKCKSQVLLYSATEIGPIQSTFLVRDYAKGRVLLLGDGQFRIIGIDAELHRKINSDDNIKGFVSDRFVLLDEEEALSAKDILKIKLPGP